MLAERLKAFLEHLGITPYAFELSIGVSKGSISKAIDNGKTIGSEAIGKIFTKYPELNLEWLIADVGTMLKNSTDPETNLKNRYLNPVPNPVPISKSKKLGTAKDDLEDVYLNSIPNPKSEELGIQNRVQTLINRYAPEQHSSYLTPKTSHLKLDMGVEVHMLDLKAAAATFGAGYLPSDNIDSLGTLTLPPLLAKRGRKYVCLPVDGDSMQPSLQRGDYVVAYLIDPSEYLELVDGRVYIISTVSDGIVIKRIKNRLREHQFIRLKSDNKEYRSYNLPAHEIASILEVTFKIDFNLSNKAKNLQDQIHSIEDRLEELQALLIRKP